MLYLSCSRGCVCQSFEKCIFKWSFVHIFYVFLLVRETYWNIVSKMKNTDKDIYIYRYTSTYSFVILTYWLIMFLHTDIWIDMLSFTKAFFLLCYIYIYTHIYIIQGSEEAGLTPNFLTPNFEPIIGLRHLLGDRKTVSYSLI